MGNAVPIGCYSCFDSGKTEYDINYTTKGGNFPEIVSQVKSRASQNYQIKEESKLGVPATEEGIINSLSSSSLSKNYNPIKKSSKSSKQSSKRQRDIKILIQKSSSQEQNDMLKVEIKQQNSSSQSSKKKRNKQNLGIELSIEILSSYSDNEENSNSPISSVQRLNLSNNDFIFVKEERFLDAYTMLDSVGEGTFGVVKICLNKTTGAKRAVKIIKNTRFKTQQEQENFINEVKLLQQLDHPGILKLLEVYKDNQQFYFVTELYEGGELFDEIVKRKRFTERDAAKIMNQILLAVNYCHKRHVVHRDLKPENIVLVSNTQIKIIDFGTAEEFDPEEGITLILGTPFYMAPEILNRQKYNEKCDIWACGVIMYILVTGVPPFKGNDDGLISAQIKKGEYDHKTLTDRKISKQAIDLISKLMEFDPQKRYSAQRALGDPWLRAKEEDCERGSAQICLSNLQSFHSEFKIQQGFLIYIVQQLMDNVETEQQRKIFHQLDENNDGVLTREELVKGFRNFYGDMAELHVDEIMKMADLNCNGTIDYTEWLAATLNKQKLLQDQKLRLAFDYFDKDKSGKIDKFELKSVMGSKRKLVDDSVWDSIIKEVDQDGDNEISYDEFKIMMQKLITDGFKQTARRKSVRNQPSQQIK